MFVPGIGAKVYCCPPPPRAPRMPSGSDQKSSPPPSNTPYGSVQSLVTGDAVATVPPSWNMGSLPLPIMGMGMWRAPCIIPPPGILCWGVAMRPRLASFRLDRLRELGIEHLRLEG